MLDSDIKYLGWIQSSARARMADLPCFLLPANYPFSLWGRLMIRVTCRPVSCSEERELSRITPPSHRYWHRASL